MNKRLYRFRIIDLDDSGAMSLVTWTTTSTDYTIGATSGWVKVINKRTMPLDALNCPTDDEVHVTADPVNVAPVVDLTLYVKAIPVDLNVPVFNPALADVGPFIEKVDPVGTIIETVTVEDQDCGLLGAEGTRFELKTDSVTEDCCIIVPRAATGGFVSADIILKRRLDFNRMGATVRLTVTAFSVMDPLNTAKQVTGSFNVVIADVKDYIPSCVKAFTGNIAENPATAGTIVATLYCDTSGGLVYTFSLVHPIFSLIGADIIITTTGSLDYETTTEYDLTVSAEVTTASLVQQVFVKIFVQPTNEVAPSWAGSTTITKAESIPVGTLLSAFTVSDSDKGGQGINPSTIGLVDNFGGTFATFVVDISSSNGLSYDVQLLLIRNLDAETKTNYSLELTASDPDSTVTYAVTLTVTNVAEYPPSCAESAVRVSIREVVLPLTVLTDPLKCISNDVGEFITFAMVTGDPRFDVNTSTGVVSLISKYYASCKLCKKT